MPGLCDSHFDPKYQQRYQASLENIQKSRSETLRILACEHDTRQPHHFCKSMNQDMHSSLKERGCVESIHERTHGAMIYSQGHVSHLIHDYHRGSKASIRCKFNETDIHTHINIRGRRIIRDATGRPVPTRRSPTAVSCISKDLFPLFRL